MSCKTLPKLTPQIWSTQAPQLLSKPSKAMNLTTQTHKTPSRTESRCTSKPPIWKWKYQNWDKPRKIEEEPRKIKQRILRNNHLAARMVRGWSRRGGFNRVAIVDGRITNGNKKFSFSAGIAHHHRRRFIISHDHPILQLFFTCLKSMELVPNFILLSIAKFLALGRERKRSSDWQESWVNSLMMSRFPLCFCGFWESGFDFLSMQVFDYSWNLLMRR